MLNATQSDIINNQTLNLNARMQLILYSKPGCHLCEGLQEKLEDIQADPNRRCHFNLEIRDITTREDWWQAYQYEVPVLFRQTDNQPETMIPRPSPRLSVKQLEEMLQKYL